MSKKLRKLKQIDGEIETPVANTLDQLFKTKTGRYSHATVEEYSKWLSESNTIDLYNHAANLGIMARGERDRLINKLIAEYKLFHSQVFGIQVNKNAKLSTKDQKALDQILSQGR